MFIVKKKKHQKLGENKRRRRGAPGARAELPHSPWRNQGGVGIAVSPMESSVLEPVQGTMMVWVDMSTGKLHPMGRTYARAGERSEEEGWAEKTSYNLITTPSFPIPPHHSRERGRRVGNVGLKLVLGRAGSN